MTSCRVYFQDWCSFLKVVMRTWKKTMATDLYMQNCQGPQKSDYHFVAHWDGLPPLRDCAAFQNTDETNCT